MHYDSEKKEQWNGVKVIGTGNVNLKKFKESLSPIIDKIMNSDYYSSINVLELSSRVSQKTIINEVRNVNLLFIVADIADEIGMNIFCEMGKVAKTADILTIGIIISHSPLNYEAVNAEEMSRARELEKYTDCLIPIPIKKFSNELLFWAVTLIHDLAFKPGWVTALDYADIKKILKDKGLATFGVGKAYGKNKNLKAMENAKENLLLDIPLENSDTLALCIIGNPELSGYEVNAIVDEAFGIKNEFDNTSVFQVFIDENLDNDDVIVGIFATGFKQSEALEKAGKYTGDEMIQIGPFFYINGYYLTNKIPAVQGEKRGGKLDNPYSHEQLYDDNYYGNNDFDFPLGRVVWDTEKDEARIYTCSCIVEIDGALEKIAELFGLSGNVSVIRDGRYCCKTCVSRIMQGFSARSIQPKIGPFFYWYDEFLSHKIHVMQGEKRGGKLDNPYSHEKLYDENFNDGDYISIPRGRVVWDTEKGRAIIYVDACIEKAEGAVAKIVGLFGGYIPSFV